MIDPISKHMTIISSIIVPKSMEQEALSVRETYVDYFRKQKGFVSSTFYKSINDKSKFNFINIVVWDSEESFQAVVNSGFSNADGLNDDNMKVLGKGFPAPIEVNPGQYKTIGN